MSFADSEMDGCNMSTVDRAVLVGVVVLLIPAWAAVATTTSGRQTAPRPGEPRLVLTIDRQVGLAPMRVSLSADLVGGADDDEEFYCPTIEWNWDDDTESASTFDCPSYQPGVTTIRRHFPVEHIFNETGDYHVSVQLIRRARELASADAEVSVR